MDLLLHNLRTIGTHHCDGTVGHEAADEIERLRGEAVVLRRLLADCLSVMRTVEAEDAHEAERLEHLCAAVSGALHPKAERTLL